MMSERIYLNNDWKFAEQFEASMTEAAYNDRTMQNVRLPHTCKETPLHYFDEHCYQMISGYRRVIEAEKEWEGKKILPVSYTHLRAHETDSYLVCRLLLEKKKR